MKKQIKQMIEYGKSVVSEVDGNPSSSRWLLLSSVGLIIGVWLSIVIGIALFNLEWSAFAGALEWGRNLLFITVLPYLSNKISGALGK